jgi:AbrB family looped-hinge helix DNA binding protein
MQQIRMSRKGIVIIPANIRKKLNLQYGVKLFIEEDKGTIKIKPKVKLRSLCGSWPELNIETITKEILDDRARDEEADKDLVEVDQRIAENAGELRLRYDIPTIDSMMQLLVLSKVSSMCLHETCVTWKH